ncbi:MAG TPA: hypothetical protein VGR57_02700 [Ktedonobacterales bacterium]|nr:hypothetical protein [Ktedonobacterales bacterium]
MHEATRNARNRTHCAKQTPARLLAAGATAAALLMVVLGCASGTSVVNTLPVVTPAGNHLPVDPTATSGPIAIHEVAASATMLGDSPLQVVATCPAGELGISGGWDMSRQGARVYAAMMAGDSWTVSFLPVGQPGTTLVTAYVECLRGAGGTVAAVQRTTTTSIAPTIPSDQVDSGGGYIGTCQPGEGLAGFGFDFGAATTASKLEMEASVPSEVLHAQTWSFRVWNYDTVAHDVSFTLQCLSTTGSGQVHYTAQKGTGLYANMSTTTATDCPTGALVAGGGFSYALVGTRAGYVGNEMSQHVTATGWQSSMAAFTSYGLIPVYPQVAAVCMTLG